MTSTRLASAALVAATLLRPVSARLHARCMTLSDALLGPAVERLTGRS